MKCASIKQLAFDSSIYLIVSKEAFLREEAIHTLLEKVGGDSNAVKSYEGAKAAGSGFFEELGSLTFFADKRTLILRRPEGMAKPDLKRLESVIASLDSGFVLIMEAESINRATALYKLSDKHGVILDIPEEKPWEKQKRMPSWLQEQAQKSGVSFKPEAASLMVQQLGTDTSILHQELEKLVIYVGDRRQITPPDVEAVCGVMNTESIWQLGDALMERNGATAMKIGLALLEEGASFYQLVRQIRSQFQTKFQICSLLNSGKGPADVACAFPYMKGRILDQNCRQAHAYGMKRFRRAMLEIDAVEALGKSVTSDERLLTEKLIAQLSL